MTIHHRKAVLTSFLLALICTPGATQTTHTDTAPQSQKGIAGTSHLGPELLSFPEIADRLSTPEHPIRCSPALRRRAALLYLKNRPHAQVLEILSRGLGIAFVPRGEKSGGLVLEPERKTERRETRWRQTFGRNVLSLFQRRELQRRILSQRNPVEVRKERDALSTEFEKLDQANAPLSPNILTLMDRQSEYYGILPDDLIPTTRIGTLWYQRNAGWLSIGDALEQSFQYRATPVDGPPGIQRSDIEGLARRSIGSAEHGYDTLVGGMLFRRGSDRISIGVMVYLVSLRNSFVAPCEVPHMGLSLPHDLRPALQTATKIDTKAMVVSVTPLESRITDDIFLGVTQLAQPLDGLGKDAVTWLNKERKDTLAVLAAEEDQTNTERKSVAPQLPHAVVDTPSAALWNWATTNDREVVMELAPLAETGWQYRGDQLKTIFPIGSGWTLRNDTGVLVVQNQLAFLDHRNVPTAALIGLVRRLKERWNAGVDGKTPASGRPTAPVPLPLTERLDYGRHAVGTTSWGTEDIPSRFWGVPLNQLDATLPGVSLWDKMSTAQHLTLQKEGHFPLAQFPLSILQTLPAMFLGYPQMNGQWFHPEALSLLRQCYLNADLHIIPTQSGLRLFGEEAPPPAATERSGGTSAKP